MKHKGNSSAGFILKLQKNFRRMDHCIVTSPLKFQLRNDGAIKSGTIVKQEEEVINVCDVEPEECFLFDEYTKEANELFNNAMKQ